MKAIAMALATSLFATASFASAPFAEADLNAQAQIDTQSSYVLSSKNKSKKPTYAYSNPLGVGPANDSR